MSLYIYEREHWTDFTWDDREISPLLGKVRNLQGRIVGKMESIGFELKNEAALNNLTADVLKSSEIEGELLNPEQVRSSIARKLGFDISGLIPSDRNVDGVVEMTVDATINHSLPLTKQRLFDWHKALFPESKSGSYNIISGQWRQDTTGPMQVVSGPYGKERIHFQAPDSSVLDSEMDAFIIWFNNAKNLDLVIKAGIAHLWFVTVHPFEDGNGRIARALTDMLLTSGDGITQRYYSMSSQIRKQRKQYYEMLETTQKSNSEITAWLLWFLNCLMESLIEAEVTIDLVVRKHNYKAKFAVESLNERQRLLINKLFDKFEGNLTTSKWAKIAKCSSDTALRDIKDLITKNILRKSEKSGRATSYELID
jgi:Fic family protein